MRRRDPRGGHILITGCSTGIGRATAFLLAKNGFKVIASARCQDHVDELQALGLPTVLLDVSDDESIASGVRAALELAGPEGISGVFANAGYGQSGALEDVSAAALREQLNTNVVGMHGVIQLLIPHMRANGGGRIVLNSSVLGLISLPMRGAYACSKHAVEGYGDALRLELKPSGIDVCLVEPGPVLTAFRANSLKALDKHVNQAASFHRIRYEGLRRKLKTVGPVAPFTVSAGHCAASVVRAFSAARPKVRYRVTVQTWVFATLKWLLPTKLMDLIATRG